MSEDSLEKETTFIDGIKVHFGAEWVLVLPDVDRPIFHILAESVSGEGARLKPTCP